MVNICVFDIRGGRWRNEGEAHGFVIGPDCLRYLERSTFIFHLLTGLLPSISSALPPSRHLGALPHTRRGPEIMSFWFPTDFGDAWQRRHLNFRAGSFCSLIFATISYAVATLDNFALVVTLLSLELLPTHLTHMPPVPHPGNMVSDRHRPAFCRQTTLAGNRHVT